MANRSWYPLLALLDLGEAQAFIRLPAHGRDPLAGIRESPEGLPGSWATTARKCCLAHSRYACADLPGRDGYAFEQMLIAMEPTASGQRDESTYHP